MGLGDMPLEEDFEERKPLESLPAEDVIEWLEDRAANCRRWAVLCKPQDVEGWLDDGRYFDNAIALIAANNDSNHRIGGRA